MNDNTEQAIVQRNIEVVRAFIRGWETRDTDACMAQCTEDMLYLNQPLEAIRGKADVQRMIASILAKGRNVEFKILNIFGYENKVITERLDCWDWNGSGTWQLKLPVCGMFEISVNGHIYEWRDYYDNELWTRDGGPSLSF